VAVSQRHIMPVLLRAAETVQERFAVKLVAPHPDPAPGVEDSPPFDRGVPTPIS
jgi:hypothetical protein